MIEAGVDEVGRGPLAGPVVSAAVILDNSIEIEGLNDSKKLTEKKRQDLSKKIKESAIAWSLASASIEEIDSINILQASLLSMKRAIEGLEIVPEKVLCDGGCNIGLLKREFHRYSPLAAKCAESLVR